MSLLKLRYYRLRKIDMSLWVLLPKKGYIYIEVTPK